MDSNVLTEAGISEILDQVVDPEIPVVTLKEMGIIRAINISRNHVEVVITPTFSGCPALEVMEAEIIRVLASAGLKNVQVTRQYEPGWTSDWITPAAREKLKQIGLAPPHIHQGNFIPVLMEPVTCPYCDSQETTLKNSFGPTPCRMIYYCNSCQQPFEQFKPL
jgi:ring-1,2-phenylacetyl-CoA epoxidase subunit PaaD